MYAALILSITIIVSLYFVIQLTGTVASSESKLLQQSHQNQSYIANLAGENNIPPVNTNATGIVKFITNDHYYDNNEVYYELNLTNLDSDVGKVEVHLGQKNENGPAVTTLYQTTTALPSEICCTSADSEYERIKLFFNGTVFPQAFEFGPLADSKNITDLVNLFNNGSAYVQVYNYHPDSLSLFGLEDEIRGQIAKQ
ncbi:MAG: CHRD domain-containing protein [Candidatus Nitrosocosmicus sp.]|nr:CHRD domain-containing protein [Candidatus Nitrosocosmicus sp.]